MRSAEVMKVNVLEMKCLRNLVSLVERIRNELVCIAGTERELASRVDQSVMRWFDAYKEYVKGVDGGSKWRAGTM